jgi:hypothetical protein
MIIMFYPYILQLYLIFLTILKHKIHNYILTNIISWLYVSLILLLMFFIKYNKFHKEN